MPSSHPVQNAIQTLVRYLEEQKEYGDTIWLTPKARKMVVRLEDLYVSRSVSNPEPAVPVQEAPPAPPRPAPVPAPAAVPMVEPTRPAPARPPVQAAPPVPAPQPAPAPESLDLIPQGNTKAEKLAWLKARAADWPPVKQLDTLRPTMVFAVGNPDAEIVFVGEAPGGEEERQKEPFVGPAGELLTKMIVAMGLKREQIYISNIVKFRPALPNQGESNRKPTAEEMATCLPFVLAEIEIIQPKVIVALGASAAEGLLGLTNSLASIRNRFYSLKNFPVMVTYHPSYLLRNQAMSERRKVWEDLMLVMEKTGLPISEKQRGYFLK